MIVERFDCFRNTSAAAKVSQDLLVHAVNFLARQAVRPGTPIQETDPCPIDLPGRPWPPGPDRR